MTDPLDALREPVTPATSPWRNRVAWGGRRSRIQRCPNGSTITEARP